MKKTSQSDERSDRRMILVVVLLVAVFAASIIDIVIPITIVDIAETFNILPGTVAVLDSIIAVASVATALFLGAFGGRFRYKSLVLVGVLLIAFCALGFFLAPSFLLAELIVPLNGVGSVLIVVTAQTFIGNSYSLDKKAKAIGWVAAAGTLATAVGSPVVGFMTGLGGWRSAFGWFMLPTAIISLLLVFVFFPLDLSQPRISARKETFLSGFRQVFTSRSAVACLVTAFFGNSFVYGSMVFEVTFLRQIFLVSPSFAALIGPLIGTLFITGGAVVGGQVVNRVGRKRLTVLAIFLSGILLVLSYFIPDLWIRQASRWAASVFIGITIAAASNLTLEQVPQFRGTTMALASAFSGVGTAVGIALTGSVLNLYSDPVVGFQVLGLTVGCLAFAGAGINLLFAKDPLRLSGRSAEPHFVEGA